MARSMRTAGVRPGMLVHNANGYGLFTGGLGFHSGAERLGATIVPVSTGRTRRQVMLLRDLQPQVITSTPSYAITIAEALADEGIAPRNSRSRSGCSAASRGRSRCASSSTAGSG